MNRAAFRRLLPALLLGLAVWTEAAAQDRSPMPGAPADACPIAADPAWRPGEQWAWSRICAGRTADLADHFGGSPDPGEAASWPEDRVLSAAFLRRILLEDPWRKALTGHGVHIAGARFHEPVDLANAALGHELILGSSVFDADVELRGVTSPGLVSFAGSRFSNGLDLSDGRIGRDLRLDRNVQVADLRLVATQIGGALALDGIRVTRTLDMEAMHVARNLTMRGDPRLAGAWLLAAEIGGDLFVEGARFSEHAMLQDIRIGSDLLVYKTAFAGVSLAGASIGGDLHARATAFAAGLAAGDCRVGRNLIVEEGSAVAGPLQLTSCHVGGDLSVTNSSVAGETDLKSVEVARTMLLGHGARFDGPVDATFARIGTNLDLTDGQFTSVDLTGTTIGAEIRLASQENPNPRWLPPAKLTLRNVTAGALQDLPDAWPREVDLEGFAYSKLGGFRGGAQTDVAHRDVRLFVDWLAKQSSYSPQPYAQLAGVLKQSGHSEKAKQILYAGKLREWREAAGFDKAWLTLSWLFTGFGYYPEVSGIWALLLVVVGIFVFGRDPADEIVRYSLGDRIVYSIDMLLPIVQLRQHHYKFDLVSRPKYYLYFHKVMGYVLITFLVIALTQSRS